MERLRAPPQAARAGVGSEQRANPAAVPIADSKARPMQRETSASTISAAHPNVEHGKVGVLLLNLGTPDGTDYWSMRRYLKEFLSDERVIEEPQLEVVADPQPHHPDRARRAARAATTHSIWNNERDEGPLKTITRSAGREAREPPRGHASASSSTGPCATPTRRREAGIQALMAQGCDRILLVPLYPQYAAATTATACRSGLPRAHGHALAAGGPRRAAYYDDPVYIDAPRPLPCSASLAKLDFEPEEHHRHLPRHAAEVSSTRAIPITASARKPRGCCAKRFGWPADALAAPRSSPASATIRGCSPTRTKPSSARARRREAPGARRARLLRGLPRDARRARRARTGAHLRSATAARNSPISRPRTTSDDGVDVIEAVVAPRAFRAGFGSSVEPILPSCPSLVTKPCPGRWNHFSVSPQTRGIADWIRQCPTIYRKAMQLTVFTACVPKAAR